MLIAHKIALDPNNVQTIHLARAAGTSRFAHNWALAERGRQYQAGNTRPTRPIPRRRRSLKAR